jgi:hypothetical protein
MTTTATRRKNHLRPEVGELTNPRWPPELRGLGNSCGRLDFELLGGRFNLFLIQKCAEAFIFMTLVSWAIVRSTLKIQQDN